MKIIYFCFFFKSCRETKIYTLCFEVYIITSPSGLYEINQNTTIENWYKWPKIKRITISDNEPKIIFLPRILDMIILSGKPLHTAYNVYTFIRIFVYICNLFLQICLNVLPLHDLQQSHFTVGNFWQYPLKIQTLQVFSSSLSWHTGILVGATLSK